MAAKILTQARLRELVHYDPSTGRITKNRKSFGSYEQGYLKLGIDNTRIYAHRAAWIYMHGEIPDGMMIDHINGIRDDNRISNLRLVTNAENMQNVGVKHTQSKLAAFLQHNNWHYKRFVKLL